VNEKFKHEFLAFAHEYCSASQNSFTLNIEKKNRVIRCLRNDKDEPCARFRFWVRAKGFRFVQSEDGEDILAVPPKGNDPSDVLFKRVATIEEFFDLIYAAHSENGHVGQAQTFRAIRAMYSLVPRIVVIKFIEMCPQCSKSHQNKRLSPQKSASNVIAVDKLAGTFAVEKQELDDESFDDGVVGPELEEQNSQNEVTHDALREILAGKLPSGLQPTIEDDVQIESETSDSQSKGTVFTCHMCSEQFLRRKALQTHIQSHQEFKPAVPLLKGAPPGGTSCKKRKLAVGFSTPMSVAKPRKTTIPRRKMIIDVDSSINAAHAIMLAASRPDIDLMAICCVGGRVTVMNACENTLRVLRACGREDVPVCRGADKALMGLQAREENLAGAAWSQKVEGHIQAEHAVSSLIRCINDNPGEITLVCLGPLTNLALALRLDPLVGGRLKDVFIIGGASDAGPSLCSDSAFHLDPEAGHIVMQEVTSAHILPQEAGDRHKLPFDHFLQCLNAGTDKAAFLIDTMSQQELELRTGGVACPEMFAVALVIDPTIGLEKDRVYTTVELKGDLTRGMMIVDRSGILGKPHNVFLVRNLDVSKTQALFGAVFVEENTLCLSLPAGLMVCKM